MPGAPGVTGAMSCPPAQERGLSCLCLPTCSAGTGTGTFTDKGVAGNIAHTSASGRSQSRQGARTDLQTDGSKEHTGWGAGDPVFWAGHLLAPAGRPGGRHWKDSIFAQK